MALEAMLKVRCCQKGRTFVSWRHLPSADSSSTGCIIACKIPGASLEAPAVLWPLLLSVDARSIAALDISWQAQYNVIISSVFS